MTLFAHKGRCPRCGSDPAGDAAFHKALEEQRAAVQAPAPAPAAVPLADGFEGWWAANRIKRVLNPAGVARMVWEASARHNRKTVLGATDSTSGFYPEDEGSTPSGQATQAPAVGAETDGEEAMAECMRMFRRDMLAAGVIGESAPPMMMSEAILGALGQARADASRLDWLEQQKSVALTRLRISAKPDATRYWCVEDPDGEDLTDGAEPEDRQTLRAAIDYAMGSKPPVQGSQP